MIYQRMRKMARINLKEIIAPHFWNTFNSKKPHQIYAGGRASTKTSQIAIKIDEFNLEKSVVLDKLNEKDENILIDLKALMLHESNTFWKALAII